MSDMDVRERHIENLRLAVQAVVGHVVTYADAEKLAENLDAYLLIETGDIDALDLPVDPE